MVVFGWLLYRLNALYEEMRGGPAGPPHRSAWLASSSAERGTLRRARGPRTLLDVSMTASAVAALVLIAIWFFFFADAPLAPLVTWLTVPHDLIASFGEIARFSGTVIGAVFSGKVLRFLGETLRQAGILILGSAIVIWGLAFLLGLSAGSRAPTSAAALARPRTPASSPPGATCARSCPTRSAT